jgi:hypothetical protein
MAITEGDLDLAGDFSVLARDDQFDPPVMIVRQIIIENLEDAIYAAIQFSFVQFSIVGAVHGMMLSKWARRPMPAMFTIVFDF